MTVEGAAAMVLHGQPRGVNMTEVRFDGRAVLVTGAGRGLGRAAARLLAARGGQVVVADNGAAMDGAEPSTAPAHAVVDEIRAAGGQACACTADIATEAGAQQAVETCLTAFGRIDALLHNASTVPDNAAVERMSSRDLELVMRVNCFGGLWLARAAWPQMTRQGYGRVVFMSSAGVYGSQGNAPYAAAKAAVIGAMRCLALEGAAHGILVNVAAPAALTRMTERLPASAYADWFTKTMAPEKAAAGVAWLLSEDCALSGEMFHIGGGRIARLRLAEGEGVLLAGDTVEDARAAIPAVLADSGVFYPKDLSERALKVARQLGFQGEMPTAAFTVTPLDKS
jgi:NAD(P)-dependent dehydrogenase (short-subunit alcohol dehydrogenase family)